MAGRIKTWVSLLAQGFCAATIGVASTPVSGQVPCSYEVTHVIQGPWCGPFWGYALTYGAAISPNGRYVVGYYDACGSGNYRSYVFDTQTSVLTTLPWPGPGWYSMQAADVTDSGIIVGDGWDSTIYGGQRGWIYDLNNPGQYTVLDPLPGGAYCALTAVNASGVACGYRSIGPGEIPQTAFTWSPNDGGTYADLGVMIGASSSATDLTDEGAVTGWTGDQVANPGTRAFLANNSKSTPTILDPVPGGLSSFGLALNGAGTVVGYGRIPYELWPTFRYRAFALVDGTMHDIPPFEGYLHNFATDVSNAGLVIGACNLELDGGNASQPFIWADGLLVDLESRLPANVLFSVLPEAVNDQGQITGHAASWQGDVVAFVLTPGQYPTAADITQNCRVDIDDLLVLVNEWGHTDSVADINDDKAVNIDDLLIMINEWSLE